MRDLIRQTPRNFNAEKSVLGAMMLSKDAAYKAMGELVAEDFTAERHRLIFNAMRALSTTQKPIDFVTLTDALEQAGNLDDCGGYGYITDISTFVPSAAHIGEYIGIVKRNSQLRQISVLCGDVNTAAGDADADPEALLAMLGGKLADLTRQNYHDDGAWTPDNFVEKSFAAFIEPQEPGVMTGFPTFDKMTKGLPQSGMVVLAARPSMGKSALAANISLNILNRGGTVVLFNMEMEERSAAGRLYAMQDREMSGGILFDHKNRTEADVKKIEAAIWRNATKWGKTLYSYSMPSITPDFIRAKLGSISYQRKIDLVVVDYLQLMQMPGFKADDSVGIVSALSRSMKLIAMEYKIPVLVLSQLNRSVEQRECKRPVMSDLRASGAIEQDADMVAFLWRPGQYDLNHPDIDAELILAKNRNGANGLIHLAWDGPRTLFTEQDRNRTPPQR